MERSEYKSKSLEDTEEIARNFLAKISGGERSSACAVGLYGNLGSGKTSFTQAVGSILGIEENITSPTFVIMKRFPLKNFQLGTYNFKTLVHIDAYRLEKSWEIGKLGWQELLADPGNLILVEWPEKVKEAMPQDHIKINFTFIDDSTRQIEW